MEDFDDGPCLVGDVLVGAGAKRTAVGEEVLRILAIHAG
jgi:hypothetical protein